MIDSLGAATRLGYCTNVHAGPDLDTTLANLSLHSARVRHLLGADRLGIGLWLSAAAARQALQGDGVERLRAHLADLGLSVFTLNGFPFSDFHEPVVKHRVYEPSWSDPRRLAYTLDLITLLHAILDPGEEGSISTLPLGWPAAPCSPVDLPGAAAALRTVAAHLARLEADTGRLIHLDLEPEPGCILQRSADVVRFWNDHILPGHDAADEPAIRRHLRVCHDVCHAAVMFEPQRDALETYRSAGIGVGKVQVSSALVTTGDHLDALAAFQEPRYLHQTSVRHAGADTFYEDLPLAITAHPTGEWRVHFHVPIHLPSIGLLGTSQADIAEAITLAKSHGTRHFEVETYAWTVLPPHLRPADLSGGIAHELRWLAAGKWGGA